MTTVRQNPLPLGVYWLDVFAPSVGRPSVANGEIPFTAWRIENPLAVKVLSRENFLSVDDPIRFFYVFQVMKPPSNFPFEKLGFPSVVKLGAPDQISPTDTVTSNDTVKKEPPEDVLDTVKGMLGTAGMYAGGALAAFLAYKLLFDDK
jgi:hypothetical protein